MWTVMIEQPMALGPAIRREWRTELADLGFVRLNESAWGTPHDLRERAAEVASRCGVRVWIARSPLDPAAADDPALTIDLSAVAELYRTIVGTLEGGLRAVDAGVMTPAHALVARTEALRAWRSVALTDPFLPRQLLPDDWPRARARTAFDRLRADTLAPAVDRLSTILARHDPHSTGQLRAYG
jgi:phenylacetic acid degradation operon negative regulatory protein